MKEEITEGYGFLFEKELIEEIVAVGELVEIKQGETIIEYENYLKSMPLLLEGAIKIMRPDKNGDELALYYLEKGDTCSMSMSCCLGQQKSEIRAIAETDVVFVRIPVQKMKEWVRKYDSWMAFVFDSYKNRFEEMLHAIDGLAFKNMHERLLSYLKDQVMIRKTTAIQISHQDIAYDLNTSRVVISRLLKSFENEGKIELGRNKIMLLEF